MSSFKLIAITPLLGCNRKFCKNLTIGKAYQFYNNYNILISKDNSKIKKVNKLENGPPLDLYSLKNGIELNFSAVVGKNGTGKSTLFELLYYLIYLISTEKEINGRRILNTPLEDLYAKGKLIEQDLNWISNCIKVKEKQEKNIPLNEFDKEVLEKDYKDPILIAIELINKYKIDIPKYKLIDSLAVAKGVRDELNNRITPIFFEKQNERKWEDEIRSEFCVSILYEVKNEIKEVCYISGSFFYSLFNPEREEVTRNINEFEFNSFFYNVCINYSHHSLNSKTLGSWINKLFHKNDGYTTPVVINPMRDSGNFDINHELKLSKERLMANLLYDLVQNNKTLLLEKYTVSQYLFSPKYKVLSPITALDYTEDFINELQSNTLFKKLLNIKKLDDYIEYWDFAIAYLEKKIIRIEENYDFLIYRNGSLLERKEALDDFLINEKSHITKKVRQVLNFLKITRKKQYRNFWKHPEGSVRVGLDSHKMLKWLTLFDVDLAKLTPSELVEYGLPGFFNIDFLLADLDGNNIEFSSLSSGEQQMILNSNSILYHLYNLNSVHMKNTSYEVDRVERVVYQNVNIVLDEIELYYHPEMQRRVVNELINSFEKIRSKETIGIESINVCILTHSPFILSDIPSHNVLTLCGSENDEFLIQTFGANIHEMLLGKFFMESTTGEQVRILIKELLDFYNKVRLESTNQGLIKLRVIYRKKSAKFSFVVKNIGEDVIREILSNHLAYIREKLSTINN
jgi:energy-coupling factor transporter ATP-binding protein EcfA2